MENRAASREVDQDAGMAGGFGRAGVVVLATTAVSCLAVLLLTGRSNPPGWSSPSKPPATNIRWSSLSKPPGSVGQSDPPVRVLRKWDRLRARAYARGDAVALRRLYVRGSQAGVRDVRLLRSYVARGLVVTGMRMRLLSTDVVRAGPRTLVLAVRDRLVTAVASSRMEPSVQRPLPTDRPSTHVITFVRHPHHAWQVSHVR